MHRPSHHATYDNVVPFGQACELGRRGDVRTYSQVRMFFSSGAAQTNGGGSFCMVMYSLLNYGSRKQRASGAGTR